MPARRRELLSAVAAGGLAGLAGCSDEEEARSALPEEPDYKGWFSDVSNYERTADHRKDDIAVVDVGAQGNGGAYAFEPAAVAVTPQTKVTWEWTGDGGRHNVVSRSKTFDSGAPVDSGVATFSYTFPAPGIYYYYCETHRGRGMKGAVFVAIDE